MTNDPSWLVALLKPRDVAPHPNFFSSEVVTGAGLCALLVAGRRNDFVRLVDPRAAELGGVSQWVADREEDAAFVRALDEALQFGSVRNGAAGLSLLVRTGQLQDPFQVAAAAILSASAFSELDDYDSALAALNLALTSAQGWGPGTELAAAALYLQRGLRTSEAGLGAGRDDAARALTLLQEVRPDEMGSFALSQGVGWSSATTLAHVKEALEDAAQSGLMRSAISDLSEVADGPSFSWQERVRSAPTHLSLLTSSSLAHGYEAFVQEQFLSRVSGTERQEMRFGVNDGAEYLFANELHYELSGHRAVRHARRRLAEFRLARASEQTPVDELRDVIRLFRHAGEPDPLNRTLDWLRAGGPIAALRLDAETVCRYRLSPERLRLAELRVLLMGAQLLAPGLASSALSATLASIEQDVPAVTPGRSTIRSSRLEAAWLAAAALGNAASEDTTVAARLLVAARAESDDQLLDLGLARAARILNWERVDADTRDAWAHWLRDGDPKHHHLQTEAKDRLNLDLPGADDSTVSLESIANELNRTMRGAQFPAALLAQAVDLVSERLSQIATNARQGTFSGGGLDVGDIAAGLAIYAGAQDLWQDLLVFLTDPAPARADSAGAFNRLGGEAERVPEFVAAGLLDAAPEILFQTRDVFGSNLVPYPAALRCLTALRVLPDEAVMTYCARLSGTAGTSGRLEAARLVTTACRRTGMSLWVEALAVQFSHDPAPEVRAEAGRSLALLLAHSAKSHELVHERLAALLTEDGLLVPTLTLRGLAELGTALPEEVMTQLRRLSDKHQAQSIRISAAELVTSSGTVLG